jgi:hypothetical protein
MRLNARHLWIGIPAVALLSAAASFYQPVLAQRTDVLVWGESYCGSYDNGEIVGFYSGSVLWWTFTSAVLAVWLGGTLIHWWAGEAAAPDPPLAAVLALAGAGAVGGLTGIAAARGLVGAVISRYDERACIEAHHFDKAVWYGALAGLIITVLMLVVRECAIAIGTACALGLAVYAAVALGHVRDPAVGGRTAPFDFAEVLNIWMNYNDGLPFVTPLLAATVLLCGLVAYARTRDLGRSGFATAAVAVIVSCAFLVGSL